MIAVLGGPSRLRCLRAAAAVLALVLVSPPAPAPEVPLSWWMPEAIWSTEEPETMAESVANRTAKLPMDVGALTALPLGVWLPLRPAAAAE